MAAHDQFLEAYSESLRDDTFAKLTLSKPLDRSSGLKNLFAKRILIKNEPMISFNFRYATRDETKNFEPQEAYFKIEELISNQFANASLTTTTGVFELKTSKKGKKTLVHQTKKEGKVTNSHDRKKNRLVGESAPWLVHLGVSDVSGSVIPKMADKFRQINKFVEIMENQLKDVVFDDKPVRIVDMGCGKGYLTFALYDYLTKTLGWEVEMTGVELRQELVDECNEISKKCGFSQLSFVAQSIQEFDSKKIDVLIALHACDTATDDAMAKGILSQAKLIVCAPCCHKQVRQQLKGKPQSNPILKHGIFKERQYEMVTDAIRALILEREGYESKVFEFVSNEHTRKNVMLVGVNQYKPKKTAEEQLNSLKNEFGIEYQQLEKLL